ncbi:hypothetical protein BO82DRAFT_397950 [Aspergillus uvarum CBS 121591]|uniref:Uncharacterized protein n=1 Tax=Aspergillus uvarum CBS 121591 TaxID=1448315 RepID=A0A319CTZ1_9EURO|nr:hypothetical protein BO82DRAFT_397950 [Aspergillus uvarum CBS 121591]PYH86207.1 hypothetical protein BO82DRAFT_397950 [Aspergillus uvarum CBS 121591]
MVGKRSPETNTSKAPKRATADNPDNDSDDQLPAGSLPISLIRLLPNQAPITLNEFRTWRTHPLPPAIPVFDDLSPQRIRVGLSRGLRPHRLDAHYLSSLAYEPVCLAPHTHSSTYSLLLQSGGNEALRADDVLLHSPFTDPRTCLFVARNSLRAYRTHLTAAVDAYHARLRNWRAQRRQWEAALLVALGRRTPEDMAALIRCELAKDKYRPWFVGATADGDEFTSPHALCDGPVVASAVRARLDHVARTISALTEDLRRLAEGGRYYVVDEFEAEYELCAENPMLDQAAFADWAVERSVHWRLAVREGMIPELDGLVRDLYDEWVEEDEIFDDEPWRPGRGGLFIGTGQEQPWGEPAYYFQVGIQRLGRPINDLFDEEIRDLLHCVEEWYFTALDEKKRAIVQGIKLRFWPMPAELYRNVDEALRFENPFGN